MDIKEISRKLDSFQGGASLKDKQLLISNMMQHVRQFVSELEEEVNLAKQADRIADDLKRLTKDNHDKDLSNDDKNAERDAQDLFDKATRARRNIDEKKRTLKEMARSIDALRSELRNYI